MPHSGAAFLERDLEDPNLDLLPELPCLLLFINLGTELLKHHFRLMGSLAHHPQSWGKCNTFAFSSPSQSGN